MPDSIASRSIEAKAIIAGQDGFTIVEVMVASAISTIVLLAISSMMTNFGTNLQTIRITSTRDGMRTNIDRYIGQNNNVNLSATYTDVGNVNDRGNILLNACLNNVAAPPGCMAPPCCIDNHGVAPEPFIFLSPLSTGNTIATGAILLGGTDAYTNTYNAAYTTNKAVQNYDQNGTPCSPASATCPIEVVTSFNATCSAVSVAGSLCGTAQQVAINYKVRMSTSDPASVIPIIPTSGAFQSVSGSLVPGNTGYTCGTSCLNGYIAMFGATGNTISDSALFQSGTGSVGIGTITPTCQNGQVGQCVQLATATADENTDLNLTTSGTSIAPSHGGLFTVWNSSVTALDPRLGELGFMRENNSTTAVSGYMSLWTTSNGVTGERVHVTSGGNVGIGTAAPQAALDVASASGLLRVGGSVAPTLPAQGAYLGWNALTGGTGETDFMNQQGGGSGGFAFYNSSNATKGNLLMMILGSGNVGIGTAAPTNMFDVNGATGNLTAAWVVFSDRRLKKDILPLEGSLDKLLNLRGVSFHWKDPEKDRKLGMQRGFIAQEVEPIIPEWVHTNPDGYKSLEKTGVEALFVEGIKEFFAKFESLVARVSALEGGASRTPASQESRVRSLERQVGELRSIVCTDHPKAESCETK